MSRCKSERLSTGSSNKIEDEIVYLILFADARREWTAQGNFLLRKAQRFPRVSNQATLRWSSQLSKDLFDRPMTARILKFKARLRNKEFLRILDENH